MTITGPAKGIATIGFLTKKLSPTLTAVLDDEDEDEDGAVAVEELAVGEKLSAPAVDEPAVAIVPSLQLICGTQGREGRKAA